MPSTAASVIPSARAINRVGTPSGYLPISTSKECWAAFRRMKSGSSASFRLSAAEREDRAALLGLETEFGEALVDVGDVSGEFFGAF